MIYNIRNINAFSSLRASPERPDDGSGNGGDGLLDDHGHCGRRIVMYL